jgi:hypothetical protein
MVAAKHTFKMEQGATFSRTFVLTDDVGTPIDITSYIARMQIRSSIAAISTILDASTTGSYMTIDGPNGKVTLTVPATVTSTYTTIDSVYDLEVQSPTGIVTRLLEGSIKLDLNVTR